MMIIAERSGIGTNLQRTSALVDVLQERQRQDGQWGEQNHPPEWWLVIMAEEFGELAQAILHRQFGGEKAAALRYEAVQLAAVSLAMIESIDRARAEQDGKAADE